MKNRFIIMLVIGIPLALLAGGVLMINQMPPESRPGGPGIVAQREYLQKHEAELVAATKRMNPKITSVQFDWNTVETGDIGNGTPQGGGKVIDVDAEFNHIKNSQMVLQMSFTKSKMPDLNTISAPIGFSVPRGDGAVLFE
ncbi:MAG: hypothetical protein LKJ69_07330 [Lactobacillus sp.]|jgi:hypothetical protein|nr:hypothetical protein [Lactobacillus sp.]MCI2033203.1 hypothetical protein [Lactobacillus sp.]